MSDAELRNVIAKSKLDEAKEVLEARKDNGCVQGASLSDFDGMRLGQKIPCACGIVIQVVRLSQIVLGAPFQRNHPRRDSIIQAVNWDWASSEIVTVVPMPGRPGYYQVINGEGRILSVRLRYGDENADDVLLPVMVVNTSTPHRQFVTMGRNVRRITEANMFEANRVGGEPDETFVADALQRSNIGIRVGTGGLPAGFTRCPENFLYIYQFCVNRSKTKFEGVLDVLTGAFSRPDGSPHVEHAALKPMFVRGLGEHFRLFSTPARELRAGLIAADRAASEIERRVDIARADVGHNWDKWTSYAMELEKAYKLGARRIAKQLAGK